MDCFIKTVFIQIDKKLMKAAGMVERVTQEVEIHSRLKHPSILEVSFYFLINILELVPTIFSTL